MCACLTVFYAVESLYRQQNDSKHKMKFYTVTLEVYVEKFKKHTELQQRKLNPAERHVLCKSIFRGWRGGEDTGEDGQVC